MSNVRKVFVRLSPHSFADSGFSGVLTFHATTLALCNDITTLAETYAKDPRNPYAAQIAKESQSHH